MTSQTEQAGALARRIEEQLNQVLVEVAPGSSFNGLLAGMRADGLLGEPPEARLRRWSDNRCPWTRK